MSPLKLMKDDPAIFFRVPLESAGQHSAVSVASKTQRTKLPWPIFDTMQSVALEKMP
jgi:hypothetical protein